ncbi:MAG: 8-oxo-dGTP pyrophosphatase MutT (NUDIX family) [Acidimicrobiales bacterium]|jgi:8-oxo-dGTP pyrophosphatase MutT (NUDIX family)
MASDSRSEGIAPEDVPIKPAATVIPLRDSSKGIEVLVLRRDTNLAFHGGSWVFPGGRVDPADFEAAGSDDVADAAGHAAVREAKEEADLTISPDDLVSLSHWTTPLGRNRRFSTWFYAVHAQRGQVTVDDGEIREFEWHTITAAIAGCETGEINLAGPTYVSLLGLSTHETVGAALAHVKSQPDQVFLPKIMKVEGETFSLYQGDPAYESGDAGASGPRHRMQMLEKGYRYINEQA